MLEEVANSGHGALLYHCPFKEAIFCRELQEERKKCLVNEIMF